MRTILRAFILSCIVTAIMASSGCRNEKETVILRYAAWNLEQPEKVSLERRMVQAFMEKYPHIKVEIDEDFVKNYDEAMKAAASSDTIPDIFMFAGNPQANTNGWCADITNITGADREWSNIPLPLRESATIKGRVIAVPTSIYFFGYFYNKSLFEKKGVSLPGAGLTIEQFKKAVQEMTDIDGGSIGLADESNIVEWYPAAANAKWGWYSWDGGKFNLNSKEFKDGVRLAKYFYENRQTYAALSENEWKKIKGTNDWEAWMSGAVALKFDGTWGANFYSTLPFKVGFLGIPGGRTCIVPDFLFISRNSKHPKEAYQFAKFMSNYSSEGFSKRMELAKANNIVVTTIPMIKNKKLIDAYFANIKIDGMREVYNNINQNSYVEGTKVLPGYNQVRWDYLTNIKVGNKQNTQMREVITNTFRGNINIDDISSELNSEANECVQIFPRHSNN